MTWDDTVGVVVMLVFVALGIWSCIRHYYED